MVLLVVCRWSLAGRCLGGGGGGMACCELSQYGSIFQWCCVLHLRAQPRYASIDNIRHPAHLWPLLQRVSCPDRRSLDKEKAACVAC